MPPKKSKREKSKKQKDEAKDVLGKKLRGKKEIWSGQTLEQRELMKMLGKYCEQKKVERDEEETQLNFKKDVAIDFFEQAGQNSQSWRDNVQKQCMACLQS